MFDYLQKFNSLTSELKQSVSSPAVMSSMASLEKKYGLDLAALVMKVMIKDLALSDLPMYLVSDFSLDEASARKLSAELKDQVFVAAANYLGYIPSYAQVVPKTAVSSNSVLEETLKAIKINLASLELKERLRNIIGTYLKGIRSKVDARLTLNKAVVLGGLGLDHKVIDEIFKTCETIKNKNTVSVPNKLSLPSNGLEKVRNMYEGVAATRDIPYDLSKALASREFKKKEAPLNLPVPEEVSEKKISAHHQDLLAPAKEKTVLNLVEPLERAEKLLAPVPIISASAKEEEKKKEEKINGLGDSDYIKNVIKKFKDENKHLTLKADEEKKETVLLAKPQEKKVAAGLEVKNITKVEQKASAPILNLPESKKQVLLPALTPVAPVLTQVIPNAKVDVAKHLDYQKPTVATPIKFEKPAPKKESFWSKLLKKNGESEKKEVAPKKVLEQKSVVVEAKNTESIVRRPAIKPSLSDIKVPPRVMSPIDEIRYLDLVNFRRLGSSPKEVTQKVMNKIKLLERDGYDKMIQGIDAWRHSPVNALYLKMGREALLNDMDLKTFSVNAQNSGKNNFLLWDEIEEIISLNSKFMF